MSNVTLFGHTISLYRLLAAALCIAHLLRVRKDGPFITLAFALFFVLALLSAQVKSFIPEDWCRYELTMYPCESQIDYNLNIKQ